MLPSTSDLTNSYLRKHKSKTLAPIKQTLPLLKTQQKLNRVMKDDLLIPRKFALEGVHESSRKSVDKLYKSSLSEAIRFRQTIQKSLKLQSISELKKYEEKELRLKKQTSEIKQPIEPKQKKVENNNESNKTELETSLEKYKEVKKTFSISNLRYAEDKVKDFENARQSMGKIVKRTNSISNGSLYNDKLIQRALEAEKQIENNRKIKQNAASATCVFKQLSNHLVAGYSVSSELGTLTNANYCRVCIAPNIIRRQNQSKNISFFGLYEGNGSADKAEYMRENFHHILANDQFIYYNFQKALARSFQKIDKDLRYHQKLSNEFSLVDFFICIIVGRTIYLIRSGTTNCCFCSELGSYVRSLQFKRKKYYMVSRNYDNEQRSDKYFEESMKLGLQSKSSTHGSAIDVKAIPYSENIDFIILGSEGLFEAQKQPSQAFWRNMLLNSNATSTSSCFEKLGQATAKLCNQCVMKDSLGRTITVIIIAFQGLKKCFVQNQVIRDSYQGEITSPQAGLSLPFVHNYQTTNTQKQLLDKLLN